MTREACALHLSAIYASMEDLYPRIYDHLHGFRIFRTRSSTVSEQLPWCPLLYSLGDGHKYLGLLGMRFISA